MVTPVESLLTTLPGPLRGQDPLLFTGSLRGELGLNRPSVPTTP